MINNRAEAGGLADLQPEFEVNANLFLDVTLYTEMT
jgi:hypothetical protein